MKDYEKTLSFYRLLGAFLDNKKYLPFVAMTLMELFKEITADKSRTLTIGILKEMRASTADWKAYPLDCADACFHDLAPYLRDPAVRSFVEKFIHRCGANDEYCVHANFRNVRLLDPQKNEEGPAAVTIVVNNLKKFKNLLVANHEGAIREFRIS